MRADDTGGHRSDGYLSGARDLVTQGEHRRALKALQRREESAGKLQYESGSLAWVNALRALTGLVSPPGLLRGSAAIRYGGRALFGVSLAKIFLYDLSELSSVARAFSFILVGGLLLAGGFFLQRLSDRMGRARRARPDGN